MAPCCRRPSRRAFTFGVTDLGPKTQFSPALIGEVSKDRYNKGDDYKWVTLNARLTHAINSNFEMQYEGSVQYMDLDSTFDKADGNFCKLTIAPTFKLDTGAGLFCAAGTAPVGQLPRVGQRNSTASATRLPRPTPASAAPPSPVPASGCWAPRWKCGSGTST